MIRDQGSRITSSSGEDALSNLTISTTPLLSESSSGPLSTRSKPRPNSTPQVRLIPSSRPTPPSTYLPSTDNAPESPDLFRTLESPPSRAPPTRLSPISTTSSTQLSPTSSPRPQNHSNLNLNKPLPIPPPPSRPPSGYRCACLSTPPPAYAPFDPHALLFTIDFPYIYAGSGDADASPSSWLTSTPRYQLSMSQTRAGRPRQLALRRLTRSESRRVALTMTATQGTPAAADAHIPFDTDLTLYTATYYSPRAAVPEMRGCKASTVAGHLRPSKGFPPSSLATGLRAGLGRKKSVSGSLKSKGRGACWELCRLTRARNGGEGDGGGGDGLGLGHNEIGTKWGYKDKDAWTREVVFAVTEKVTDAGRCAAACGELEDEEGKEEEGLVRRVTRKGRLGLSLRRGFGNTTMTTSTVRRRRDEESDWTRQHRRNDGGEQDDGALSQTRHRKQHDRVFEWRAGSVSLTSTTTTASHPSAILPNQLLATSSSTTSTQIHPFTAPIHAATAPASTLHRQPSTTALALRRVASRVSLRTAPSCSTLSSAPTLISSPSTSCCSRTAQEAALGVSHRETTGRGEMLRVREGTRRWLRLEKPLERRALDALVAAWIVGVWMEGEGSLS